MTVTETPMLRWSSVRDCPRKAVLEATTEPDRDWSREEKGYMLRGKSIGRDFILMLAAGNQANHENALIYVDSGPDRWVPEGLLTKSRDTAAFVAELRVPWEMGVGHADCFVAQHGTVIEVLSSAHSDLAHSKLLQGVGYARELPEAKAVCLAIVNPSNMTEERVIVVRDSDQWKFLAEEVDERIAEVIAWRDTREWPDRVCAKPGDAWGHFCRHAVTCFAGWEAPETPVYDGDMEQAQMLAIQLAHVKAKRREIAQSDKLLEGEQKAIQSEFAKVFDYGKQIVGGFAVKRSARSTTSFKLALAAQDSRLSSDLLAEFSSVTPWDAWDIEQVGAVETVADDKAPF